MADREFDLQSLPKGISLEVTDQSWCLTASTRSVVDGLLFGFVSLLLGLGVVFFLLLFRADGKISLLWVSLFVLALLITFARMAVMRLLGKIVITVEGHQSSVFTGIGSVGRRQQFHWARTKWIHEEHVVKPKSNYYEIVLIGPSQVRFGRLLSKVQRHSVLHALRQLQQMQPLGDGS